MSKIKVDPVTIKEEPEVWVFGHEQKPLSEELKRQYNVAAKIPKRKVVNAEGMRSLILQDED